MSCVTSRERPYQRAPYKQNYRRSEDYELIKPYQDRDRRDPCRAEADCELLLDVNNLYVNQVNLGLDAAQALATLPLERVREVHLAGFEDKGGYLIDAHNNPVSEQVWALYADLVARLPDVAVCIEWDNDIPVLGDLLAEAHRAAGLRDRARGAAA